jgi:uncharacterized protein YdeI (YjbR/CyaY-like superfamily)
MRSSNVNHCTRKSTQILSQKKANKNKTRNVIYITVHKKSTNNHNCYREEEKKKTVCFYFPPLLPKNFRSRNFVKLDDRNRFPL